MKFLWTDDHTGKFSDTTLRTWMLFLLAIIFAIALFVLFVLSFVGFLNDLSGEWADKLITLFNTIALAAFGNGALYLGKRVSERPSKSFPSQENSN